MNLLNISLIIVTAYLTVFLEGWLKQFNLILGNCLDILPALIVYCALSTNLAVLSGVAIVAGLWYDSLSANPLGISILPLFVVGLLIHGRRELILREQPFARFILGFAASSGAFLLSAGLLLFTGSKPLLGFGTFGQLAIASVSGGVLTLGCFELFDRLGRTFNYQPLPESSFRSDREIKRGRG